MKRVLLSLAILLIVPMGAEAQEVTTQETVGTIAGGVIGGALGSQVGKGRGKTVATIIGTGAGMMIGNAVSRPETYGEYAQQSPRQSQPRRSTRNPCEYIYYQAQNQRGETVKMAGCACLDRALGAMRLTENPLYCEQNQ